MHYLIQQLCVLYYVKNARSVAISRPSVFRPSVGFWCRHMGFKTNVRYDIIINGFAFGVSEQFRNSGAYSIYCRQTTKLTFRLVSKSNRVKAKVDKFFHIEMFNAKCVAIAVRQYTLQYHTPFLLVIFLLLGL